MQEASKKKISCLHCLRKARAVLTVDGTSMDFCGEHAELLRERLRWERLPEPMVALPPLPRVKQVLRDGRIVWE